MISHLWIVRPCKEFSPHSTWSKSPPNVIALDIIHFLPPGNSSAPHSLSFHLRVDSWVVQFRLRNTSIAASLQILLVSVSYHRTKCSRESLPNLAIHALATEGHPNFRTYQGAVVLVMPYVLYHVAGTRIFSHGHDAISSLIEEGALIVRAWKAGLYTHAVLYSEMHVEGSMKRNCKSYGLSPSQRYRNSNPRIRKGIRFP